MKTKPETREKPTLVRLRVACDREDCKGRSPGGYCYAGDPQWRWRFPSGRDKTFECRSYDRRK